VVDGDELPGLLGAGERALLFQQGAQVLQPDGVTMLVTTYP
jgi:hypothetical protein